MITSSESASSIDTQFQAMFDELKNGAKALPIILDDKKCYSSLVLIGKILNSNSNYIDFDIFAFWNRGYSGI